MPTIRYSVGQFWHRYKTMVHNKMAPTLTNQWLVALRNSANQATRWLLSLLTQFQFIIIFVSYYILITFLSTRVWNMKSLVSAFNMERALCISWKLCTSMSKLPTSTQDLGDQPEHEHGVVMRQESIGNKLRRSVEQMRLATRFKTGSRSRPR